MSDVSRAGTAPRQRQNNLPRDGRDFVNREHEVAEAKRMLSETRLLTFTGAPGVGKTRLAIRVAKAVQRRFPDGVWFVELAALGNGDLLLEATLDALPHADREHHKLPLQALLDYARSRRMLLVLDNCEHLLDACAALVTTLLRAAPRLRIIATSRQSLGAYGERLLVVAPLAVPPQVDPLPGTDVGYEPVARFDAVTLFAKRAAAVRPGFRLTTENFPVVSQICRQLEGIPLALELAAAQLATLSLDELATRLDQRLPLLAEVTSPRFSPTAVYPHQRTLRATIDWSYGLCSPNERRLWARTALFPGGFDLAAAEACADEKILDEDILDLVTGLVEKSILAAEGAAEGMRFRQLETIREYGCERLAASGHLADVRRCHCEYYLRLAEQADAEWFGPRQLYWHNRLRVEHPNLRMALDSALAEADPGQSALRMAGRLCFYWLSGAFLPEGRHWLDRALAFDRRPSRARLYALHTNAWIAALQGDTPAARAMVIECRSLAERFGDEFCLACTEAVAGLAEMFTGPVEGAISHLRKSLRHEQLCGARNALTVIARGSLAISCALAGDVEVARDLCDEARAICEADHEQWVLSWVLVSAGTVAWCRGESRQADADMRTCLRLKQMFRDVLGAGHCVETLAWIAAQQHDAVRAARLLGVSQKLWRVVGRTLYGSDAYLAWHDRCESGARRELGEKAFNTIFEEGGRLGFDEAVAFALEETPA